jgi:hypothetical protein
VQRAGAAAWTGIGGRAPPLSTVLRGLTATVLAATILAALPSRYHTPSTALPPLLPPALLELEPASPVSGPPAPPTLPASPPLAVAPYAGVVPADPPSSSSSPSPPPSPFPMPQPADSNIPAAPPMSIHFPLASFKVICCLCFQNSHNIA